MWTDARMWCCLSSCVLLWQMCGVLSVELCVVAAEWSVVCRAMCCCGRCVGSCLSSCVLLRPMWGCCVSSWVLLWLLMCGVLSVDLCVVAADVWGVVSRAVCCWDRYERHRCQTGDAGRADVRDTVTWLMEPIWRMRRCSAAFASVWLFFNRRGGVELHGCAERIREVTRMGGINAVKSSEGIRDLTRGGDWCGH